VKYRKDPEGKYGNLNQGNQPQDYFRTQVRIRQALMVRIEEELHMFCVQAQSLWSLLPGRSLPPDRRYVCCTSLPQGNMTGKYCPAS
jgi:hypothetical protein